MHLQNVSVFAKHNWVCKTQNASTKCVCKRQLHLQMRLQNATVFQKVKVLCKMHVHLQNVSAFAKCKTQMHLQNVSVFAKHNSVCETQKRRYKVRLQKATAFANAFENDVHATHSYLRIWTKAVEFIDRSRILHQYIETTRKKYERQSRKPQSRNDTASVMVLYNN